MARSENEASVVTDSQDSKPHAFPDGFDTESHKEFYDYYAEESITEETFERFQNVRDIVLKIAGQERAEKGLNIADIGCNAGTSSMLWAELGHRVIGVDINEPLIELARKRAAERSMAIDYRVGSATELPIEDASVDICMAVELLEHVQDWESCVKEFVRILKPGGLLWMSTTNTLCPKQFEFTLPGFSWYPKPLKEHYIKLALTTRPEIANYAKYPAFNWFTPYGLKRHLKTLGMETMDRFDIAHAYKEDSVARTVLGVIRAVPPIRLVAHILTSDTRVLSRKL